MTSSRGATIVTGIAVVGVLAVGAGGVLAEATNAYYTDTTTANLRITVDGGTGHTADRAEHAHQSKHPAPTRTPHAAEEWTPPPSAREQPPDPSSTGTTTPSNNTDVTAGRPRGSTRVDPCHRRPYPEQNSTPSDCVDGT